MASYKDGKKEIREMILQEFPRGASCLDVGACDGEYWNLLNDHLVMDAVEVFIPNIERNHLIEKYNIVHPVNIVGFEYDFYDVIIFGDIIEHLTVKDAQAVLEYAKSHSNMVIVAVPFLYKQGPIYGNPYEEHIQFDLTDEVFRERYSGFKLAFSFNNKYGYYIHKRL